MPPQDFKERTAPRTRAFVNAHIRRSIGAKDVRRVLKQRRRSEDDFSVRERQCPLLGQSDRRALRPNLAGVRLVDDQDPRGVPSKVSRRPARNDLEGPASEAF
jgi:hypothetical protein